MTDFSDNHLEAELLEAVFGGASYGYGGGCLGESCGYCLDACCTGAITLGPEGPRIESSCCDQCGECKAVCPTGAIPY